MTDIERDDALDHLSSEELETQAFGPAPTERRTIRGLIDRPTSGGVVYRVQEPKRRWPRVLGVAVAAVVAFAAVDLAMGTGGGPDVFIMAEGSDDAIAPIDEAAIEASLEAEMDALEAEMDALDADLAAEAEAMEEATDLLGEEGAPVVE